MKIKNNFSIGVLCLQLAILGLSSSAFATTGKVVKAKGKKVLIELPIDPRLQAGDTVEIDTLELRSPASSRAMAGGRRLTIGGSMNGGELHFYSRSNGYPGDTLFDIVGRGGWNYGKYEYGPLAEIQYESTDSNSSQTTLGAGGFFDWNLVANTPGASDVYGIGGDAEVKSISVKAGTTSNSSSGLALNGGAFYKYFLFRSDTCLRFDGDLHIALYNNYSETGLRFLAGIQTYF